MLPQHIHSRLVHRVRVHERAQIPSNDSWEVHALGVCSPQQHTGTSELTFHFLRRKAQIGLRDIIWKEAHPV